MKILFFFSFYTRCAAGTAGAAIDRGARPPTEQVFFPPEERGEMPQWKRIWRTTTPSGFNREGDTELVAEEGQQPTV